MKTNPVVVALGAALSLVLPGHAAQDPQEPAFRADAVVVTVDVVVRDRRGNLVTDLTAGDFTVRASGAPQRILSFIAPRAAAGAAARSSANDAAREVGELTDSRDLRAPSVVVLAFDRLSPQAQAMAVEAARTYVSADAAARKRGPACAALGGLSHQAARDAGALGHHAQTDDVIGIFSIDSPIRTLQPFTRAAPLFELRRDEQPVAGAVLPLGEPDRNGRIRQVSRLPIGTLEPGTYELRIVVRGGGQATAGRAQFTLIP